MSRLPKDEVYTIYQQHFANMEEGKRALKSQCKTLKRLAKKYPDCVFIMGLSEHDDEYAKKINMNQGKPGHPEVGFERKTKRCDVNYKVTPHLHTYIGGRYAASLAKEFAALQSQLYHKKHPYRVEYSAVLCAKSKGGQFPLGYVERQSTYLRYSNKKVVREYANKRNADVKKKLPVYRGKRSVYARKVREF